MLEVYPNLFIGSEGECFFKDRDDWAVIHACKSPCHQKAVGYKGNLSPTHPNYLTYEVRNHLFLNMIDPPAPLFKPQLFMASLDFIEKHISERKVLIHCNLGLSRSPSIALLYLAKRAKVINGESYMKATQDFRKLFRYYKPRRGIAVYLDLYWLEFQ
ncbi:MAG: dual specificity protein phosphatase family protein [Nitrosopumilus sp.]|nr:dual specificity protein phosphatase family protein [Candidatus Bathyarchaeota archaeon]MDH5666177.1 dual specificity protein phosphatase family protein [Nitrosopumilus sp.]